MQSLVKVFQGRERDVVSINVSCVETRRMQKLGEVVCAFAINKVKINEMNLLMKIVSGYYQNGEFEIFVVETSRK